MVYLNSKRKNLRGIEEDSGMELETVMRLDKKAKALAKKIETLRDAQQNIVPVMDGLPKSHGKENSRLEEMATRIMTLEEELNAVKAEQVAAAVDLTFEIIERVPYPMTNILILRYVGCRKFAQIISEFNWTEPHIYRLHAEGVKAFKAAELKRSI